MLICKVCNHGNGLEGNGYCSEHSTSGTGYFEENRSIRITFRVSPEEKEQIEKSAKREKISVGELIRDILWGKREYFSRSRKRKELIPSGKN